MEEYILYSLINGVYLGSCLGLGFWSKLDPAGQVSAVTFKSKQDAKNYIASWDNPNSIPDIKVKQVTVRVSGRLDVGECKYNGFEGWY